MWIPSDIWIGSDDTSNWMGLHRSCSYSLSTSSFNLLLPQFSSCVVMQDATDTWRVEPNADSWNSFHKRVQQCYGKDVVCSSRHLAQCYRNVNGEWRTSELWWRWETTLTYHSVILVTTRQKGQNKRTNTDTDPMKSRLGVVTSNCIATTCICAATSNRLLY